MTPAERYARAGRFLPANLVPRIANNAIEGYWLDEQRYFFVAETVVDETIRRTPMLFDAARGAVTTVMNDNMLTRVIPEARQDALAEADFDMSDPLHLAVRLSHATYLVDLAGGALAATIPAERVPVAYAPGGRWTVRVKGHDLEVVDRHDGSTRLLTDDGVADWPWGQAPQTFAAPVTYRKRPFPVVQFSADGRWVLVDRIDERDLPLHTLVENAPADGDRPRFHTYRYATAADEALPIATTTAIELETGRRIASSPHPVHMFPPVATRAAWFAGNAFYRLRTDRWHRHLELAEINLADGAERVVAQERVEDGYLETHPFVGAPPNIRVLPETGEIIWWSERDGRAHLYLLDKASGETKRQITRGAFQVRDILHVDAAARTLVLAVTGLDISDYLLRTVLRVHLDREEMEVLVRPDGVDLGVRPTLDGPLVAERAFVPSHGPGSVSPDGRQVVIRRSGPLHGVTTAVVNFASGQETQIAEIDGANAPSIAPLWLDLVAADGVTPLRTALYLPTDHDGTTTLPLIDGIYPGPQTVVLARSFWGRMQCQAQALAELGFAVMVTDTRGLPLRERALHQAGYGDLLEPQLSDHVAIVAQLRERFPFIDRQRAGIVGSSAGGYGAATAMFRYPDTFTAGVAICGTDDPAHYFAGWLEKYVGPDVDGRWARQITGSEAAGLEGALLIIQGDMDENVHPSHAVSLARRLIEAGKRFEMALVPNEGHLLQATSADVQRRIWDFFLHHMRGEIPPDVDAAPQYRPQDLAAMSRAASREATWN